MVPASTGLANWMRRPYQCAQTATWSESLSISRRRWHETMGWIGSNCRQSDQYRKNFGLSGGGSLKRYGKKRIDRTRDGKSGDRPIRKPIFATKSSYTGFVNGDTASTLGGTLFFDTTATTTSPIGSYTVTPGGLASSKYSITFVSGTLNVVYAYVTDKN